MLRVVEQSGARSEGCDKRTRVDPGIQTRQGEVATFYPPAFFRYLGVGVGADGGRGGGLRGCAETSRRANLGPRMISLRRKMLLFLLSTNRQQRVSRSAVHVISTELSGRTQKRSDAASWLSARFGHSPLPAITPKRNPSNQMGQRAMYLLFHPIKRVSVRCTHFQWLWPHQPMTKDVPTKQIRKPTAGGLTCGTNHVDPNMHTHAYIHKPCVRVNMLNMLRKVRTPLVRVLCIACQHRRHPAYRLF